MQERPTVLTYVAYDQDNNIVDVIELKEGDTIKHTEPNSKKKEEYLKNLTGIGKMTDDLGGFYMLYYSEKLFDGKVSEKHISRLIFLATYIEYDTNRLVYSVNGKTNIPFTEEDVKYELGLKKNAYIDFKKELKENNIIQFTKDGIFLSKEYFNKGEEKQKNNYFGRMYIKTIRQVYVQISPKQHKTLSHLFRLMPYVNYEYNVITSQPNSPTPLRYRLNKIQVAELLNMDIKTYERVEKELLKLKINFRGESYFLIGSVTVRTQGKRQFYAVNPLLYSSGNNYEQLNSVWMQLLKDERD